MKPRFLLDENVNRAVQRQLQRLDREIEVYIEVQRTCEETRDDDNSQK
jgi:hypothetical protein